jgi:glycogen operon protein
MGPTLSFRGIDNATYYRLVPGDERYYTDFTGCGNALDLREPGVLQLVMDSLRYWVEEMHVDGFRFDLATTLARESGNFDENSSFLDTMRQDPVLSHVKLVAEPWDVGHEGYRLGGFQPGWAEWNDRYRDTVRRYWKGDSGQLGELASRVTGSSDIFDRRGRRPWASINFVTAHDGFTLRDLVSYDHKHNEANGEGNADGSDHNHSWNCGVEGETEDLDVRRLRLQQSKNLLASLLLSQGVPMLLAGDELGNTQSGNNNAYCQDGELSWIDWSPDAEGRALLDFVRRLLRFRHDHIALHRHRFFQGLETGSSETKDITWLRADGMERGFDDWGDPDDRMLGFVLSGEAHGYHVTEGGEPEPDDTFLLLMNADHRAISCRLPDRSHGRAWQLLLDTAEAAREGERVEAGEDIRLEARSLALFREENAPPARTPESQ